jgi:hypothetical protein
MDGMYVTVSMKCILDQDSDTHIGREVWQKKR